ncbi:MAG TPA: oxidoreductase, partial [Blastocatellia bacterium]|nr:oxidoreductase [Blastocatellia bacterium]
FGARSTAMEVVAGIDLRGKTAIVTGASSGLGIETARALAAAGAEVILPVRNLEKGEAVATDIRTSTNNQAVSVLALDLADWASVRRCADEFLATGKPLHILINNAAIMACPLTRTAQGYEAQFATNHLGHFLFTGRLVPALQAGAPSRVVCLSSLGHRLSPVVFDDIHFHEREYDKWKAYGQAKTANALFAVELNQRLHSSGVTANAVHPGGIMTGLQKHLTREEMIASGWMDEAGNLHPIFKNVEQGAATSVWGATAPELEGKGGLYLEDCNEGVPAVPEKRTSGYFPHALDPEAAARLWKVSEEMVGEKFDVP